MDINEGTYQIDQLQITHPHPISHGIRCEGLLRILSWVNFDLPDHCKRTLSILLQAAGNGCLNLHMVPIEGRDIRNDPIASEYALQQVLIDMIPTPGQANAEGGLLIRTLLAKFLGCRIVFGIFFLQFWIFFWVSCLFNFSMVFFNVSMVFFNVSIVFFNFP